MNIARHDPLVVLGAIIEAAVPDLAGAVRIGPQPASVAQTWPSLTILPSRFRAEFTQFSKYKRDVNGNLVNHHPGGDLTQAVLTIGRWVGTVQLRVGATAVEARRVLEQAVLDVFTAGRGVVSAPVPDSYDAYHSWDLAEDDWQDEMLFDNVVEGVIALDAVHPILVLFTGVQLITELNLQFTEDMVTEPFASIPAADVESFTVLTAPPYKGPPPS